MAHPLKLSQRILIRTISAVIAIITLDLIVFHIFPYFNQNHSVLVALAFTYFLSAYALLPLSIRLTGILTRREHIPTYCSSAEGLPSDPVNIVIVSTQKQLKEVFKTQDWHIADRLNIKTAWKMINSFARNRPYPTAPFSNLYLFGRKQDIGLQKSVDGSPRKRHHVRFWAFDPEHYLHEDVSTAFWHAKALVDPSKATVWIGACTKDTGFGFTRNTYQLSHSVDEDTIAERKYIVSELKNTGHVERSKLIKPHGLLPIGDQVNSFVADGAIELVYLKD